MSASSFALWREMNEAPDILRRFDPTVVASWLKIIKQRQTILLTGEGSSRIFPARNLIARARRTGAPWHFETLGAREAAEHHLSTHAIIAASNSGKTRELVDLFSSSQDVPRLALTATPHSPVIGLADQTILLSCGPEQAIAATKSVFEQALTYQALLQGPEWQHKEQAADLCRDVLNAAVPPDIARTLANASTVYIAGRDDGVAEELALKSCEIIRTPATYLEGTLLLHGLEEVMRPSDVVILIEPFAAEHQTIRTRLVDTIGLTVIAISSAATPFPTLAVPRLDGFDAYFQLLAGWSLLVAAGLDKGVDLDRAKRAQKSGNAV